MPVCLSACLFVRLPVCMPVCLSVCLSAYPFVCLPRFRFVCLPICLPVYNSVCLSVCLSTCLPFCLSVCSSLDSLTFCLRNTLVTKDISKSEVLSFDGSGYLYTERLGGGVNRYIRTMDRGNSEFVFSISARSLDGLIVFMYEPSERVSLLTEYTEFAD